MTRRYEILDIAGHGGMGSVYRARLRADGGFEKIVAVKILSDSVSDDADLARRLRDEARILGRLQHRAIVRVEGLFRLRGRWTIAMEFIEGIDLGQAVEKRGKVPGAAVIEIVKEVAAALNHAHSAADADGKPLRIVHRDLKPANLRITPAGEVKVLDFGVARANFEGREAETRAGGFGSIGYVPPERVDGEELPAGDVYALGIVAWELISGAKFGPGHLLSKKHAELVDEKLAALKKVPDPVKDLLREMMSFDPELRPPAREVERKAGILLTTLAGSKGLRDWAEDLVPPLMRQVREDLGADPLVGLVLEEESASDASKTGSARSVVRSVAPPPPPPRKASGGFGCVRMLVYLSVLVLIAFVTPVLLAGVLALGVWVGTLSH